MKNTLFKTYIESQLYYPLINARKDSIEEVFNDLKSEMQYQWAPKAKLHNKHMFIAIAYFGKAYTQLRGGESKSSGQ